MLSCLMFADSWSTACRQLLQACVLSAGRGALEAVQVPPGVRVHLSVRATRLMRQSHVSAW